MILGLYAPAKINLGLHVLRRRPDGYHDIETIFVRIPWSDYIVVRAADQLSMTCSDPDLPVDNTNLCLRAARLLSDVVGIDRGASIHLDKRVPYGAGLGGGSSDAATTLHLLTELWRIDLSKEVLLDIALRLGSDVPFFLNGPVAYATGRGEKLSSFSNLEGEMYYRFPFSLVVVAPSVQVSTARAYGMIQPRDHNRPDLVNLVRSNDLDRWRSELINDFEGPVLKAYPVIAATKEMLIAAGADYASLSGSGSAVFGVFEDDSLATGAAEVARQTGHRVWHGKV